MKRKIWKQRAKTYVKRHYWIFLILCLAAAGLRVDYAETLKFLNIPAASEEKELNREEDSDRGEAQEEDAVRTTSLGLHAVWEALLQDQYEQIQEESQAMISQAEAAEEKQLWIVGMGRRRGVLAGIINRVSSGALYLTVYTAIRTLMGSENLAAALFILLSLAVVLAVWLTVTSYARVILKRMFLDGRSSGDLPFSRVLFLVRVRKILKVAVTLTLEMVFRFLWNLTIVGGIIKRYSYYLVPYIVAENPGIPACKAITLSRKMMKGHKWECFQLEVSFLGWDILSMCTAGLSGIFYSNLYLEATRVEYFSYIKELAEVNKIPGMEWMKDTVIYEKAGETVSETADSHFYQRHYSLLSLISQFFFFSILGWVWEVSLHLLTYGEFVNRGVLRGPWLPIYGVGSVVVLTALKKWREKPWLEFIAIVFLSGILEYGTAWLLEVFHGGKKWWDYSGYFLNIHGRICAEGLFLFGLGGMMIVYFAAPLLDTLFRRISVRILLPVCTVLLLLCAADLSYSCRYPNTGKGISTSSSVTKEYYIETEK